jgi:transcriptional regulator with XRE-family HTH domain
MISRSLYKTVCTVRQTDHLFYMKNDGDAGHSFIARAIAHNLKDLREREGLSINELARTAGIGKATLSVLESGAGNPNIETIWALARALKVPFGRLVDVSTSEVRVIRSGESLSIDTRDKLSTAGLLASRTNRGAFELYQFDLAKGAKRLANSHAKGTIEHVFVKAGRLITGPTDNPLELLAGDFASFPADVPHLYKAPDADVATLMIMDYR